ncbi:bZIP transcription factor [Aspergillus saccharolyticus JOP 1030-1]|uniref:BZIP domain-containing protein n=1 Tax=Aspergillus saccharolyticus JOP 1030-1 TaxID=1450539 RepID=A0A318ZR51_9EURO|nr:hypothetical protein BP01DRAFT_362099 [Aspergillus saccharolyticus JOP 1030-1]PYH49125.1 hypothetical protein BP01DRAFT_362099 [Aspergillus saccharolyticus JOP 1030-1]
MYHAMAHMSYASALEGAAETDATLVPWETIHDQFFGSSHPSSDSMASPQITSLLSACSYPVPEAAESLPEDSAQPMLFGGITSDYNTEIDSTSSTMDSLQTNAEQVVAERPKRPRAEAEKSASGTTTAKRGRPRKVLDESLAEDPEERRRRQIRLAQRAYRSRKEANMSSLKTRITQLESVVEQMSSAVLSFSDHLVQSGVLESNPGLAEHLHYTVQTCLDLAKDANTDANTDAGDLTALVPSKTSSEPAYVPGDQFPFTNPFDLSKPYAPGLHASLPEKQVTPFRPTLMPPPRVLVLPEIQEMELSVFMSRLHMSCIYHGCLALCDDNIGMERIMKHFCLPLTIVDRKRLTALFYAALNTKDGKKRYEDWKEIPFFSLGGAGTHYPWSAAKAGLASYLHRPGVRWVVLPEPLLQFPPNLQKALAGDWFDMGDLEGYLREKGVRLFAHSPTEVGKESSLAPAVNAKRLIKTLTGCGICLGWTPGFRRRDVENALRDCAGG